MCQYGEIDKGMGLDTFTTQTRIEEQSTIVQKTCSMKYLLCFNAQESVRIFLEAACPPTHPSEISSPIGCADVKRIPF